MQTLRLYITEVNNQRKNGLPKTNTTIDADIETVWNNVIAFPKMDEPTEFIFRAGISYPINAQIEGHGVGAVHYCNFNTG